MTHLITFLGIIVAAVVMFFYSGCASVSVKTTTPKGVLCEATGYTLFLDINAAAISACGAKTNQLNSAVNTEVATKLIETAIPLLKAAAIP